MDFLYIGSPKTLLDGFYSDAMNGLLRLAGKPELTVNDDNVEEFIQSIHAAPSLGRLAISRNKIHVSFEQATCETWPERSDVIREPLKDLIVAKFPQFTDVNIINDPRY